MHPEILRELASQRGAEMRDRAHRILLARSVSKLQRARRRGLSEADEFAISAIPDFADRSLLVMPSTAAVRARSADSQPDRVPATRHAA